MVLWKLWSGFPNRREAWSVQDAQDSNPAKQEAALVGPRLSTFTGITFGHPVYHMACPDRSFVLGWLFSSVRRATKREAVEQL